MSEQPKANEESKPTETKTVSYEEFSKLKSDFESKSGEITKLREENSRLRDTVLSPEYMEKLVGPEKKSNDDVDVENMTKKELVEFTARIIAEQLTPGLEARFKNVEDTLQRVSAEKELAETKAKFPDFNEYKDKIREKLQTRPNLTFEDAYKIVRQEERLEKDDDERKREAKTASEKPGGISRTSTQKTDFKNKVEANDDAWERIVGKGDSIQLKS